MTKTETWDSDLDEKPEPKSPEPEKPKDLTDQSIMWFGSHKGKQFRQIPDHWFLWYYGQSNIDARIRKYIEEYLPHAKVK